jgi:hypothetical protein
VTPATAARWTCSECGVTISLSGTLAMPLPEAWEDCTEGTFCLGCRRQRIAEAAVDAAPDEMDRDGRARLRRTALVEFEVARSPDKTNGSIAKVCRTSIPAVAAVRRQLGVEE